MPRKKDAQFLDSEQFEDVLRAVSSDETFHIGQVYEDEAVTTRECKNCGGCQFNVGQGSYFTALRCPKCGWECCIHEG